MEENTKVVIQGDTKEVIIRHGEALTLREPKLVKLGGVITAPWEFISKRKEEFRKEDVHVIYNLERGIINLVCMETNPYAKEVTGELKLNPAIETIGINAVKTYKLKDLIQLLRFNSGIFKHEKDHSRIVAALMKFNAKVSQEIKNENDLHGNKSEGFDQKVLINADLIFTATMCIFKGFSKHDFKVELMFEIRSSTVEFWFESVELAEVIESQREEIVLAEIKKMEADYVCIQQ